MQGCAQYVDAANLEIIFDSSAFLVCGWCNNDCERIILIPYQFLITADCAWLMQVPMSLTTSSPVSKSKFVLNSCWLLTCIFLFCFVEFKVAGQSTEFVNKVLDKIRAGVPHGGLDELGSSFYWTRSPVETTCHLLGGTLYLCLQLYFLHTYRSPPRARARIGERFVTKKLQFSILCHLPLLLYVLFLCFLPPFVILYLLILKMATYKNYYFLLALRMT